MVPVSVSRTADSASGKSPSNATKNRLVAAQQPLNVQFFPFSLRTPCLLEDKYTWRRNGGRKSLLKNKGGSAMKFGPVRFGNLKIMVREDCVLPLFKGFGSPSNGLVVYRIWQL